MKKFKELLDIIDSDWIKENPESALELVQCLWHELKQRKDYIESLNNKLLLQAALMEGMKDKE